jgi:hypothetical protein
VSSGPEREPLADESAGYEWPEDPSGGDQYRASFYLLAIMYSAPFLILLLFPALAWLALLPFAVALRWNAHPPHRRRLIWIYVVTGLISLAPWIPMVLG